MLVVDMEGTGRNIQRMRREHGMKVADIQEACGFNTPATIYKWMRGMCMPSLNSLVILAALFDVRIDDIVAIRVV